MYFVSCIFRYFYYYSILHHKVHSFLIYFMPSPGSLWTCVSAR